MTHPDLYQLAFLAIALDYKGKQPASHLILCIDTRTTLPSYEKNAYSPVYSTSRSSITIDNASGMGQRAA